MEDIDYIFLDSSMTVRIASKISQTMTEFYSFRWFDTSMIPSLNFGTELIDYRIHD